MSWSWIPLLKSALLCIVLWSYITSMPAVFASLDQWLNWPYPWAKHIIIWGASFGILVMCAMNFMCCFLANTPIQVVLAICRMSSWLNFQAQFWLTHTWFLFLMYLSILWNYHHLGGGLESMPDFPGLWKIQKVICIDMLCSTPFSETNPYPFPKPTLTLPCYQLTVVGLGKGQVCSCQDTDIDLRHLYKSCPNQLQNGSGHY